MQQTFDPQLDAPGAGLPIVELWVARALFAAIRLVGSSSSFDNRFRRERAHIRRAIETRSVDELQERVLIQRLSGLEDSSRYWSVLMTLDHLRIVNEAIRMIISELSLGRIPPGAASTAAVKPDPEVSQQVIEAYETSCDELLSTISGAPSLQTSVRFAHPWFGPMNASGWHALAGVHMAIHRKQIGRILEQLR